MRVGAEMLRRTALLVSSRAAGQMVRLSTSAGRPRRAPRLVKVTNQKLEPQYLTPSEPMVPVYDLLNIRLQAYDFAVLEHYAKWVHRMLRAVDVDVEDCWATPHTSARVTRLKPNTAIVETSYDLNLYERNVQLRDLPTTMAPVVIDLLQHSTPPGVQACLQRHKSEYDEVRYVPDLQLKELKQQLAEVGMDPDKRKRRAAQEAAAAAAAAAAAPEKS
ncbi:39S ribosomal protein L48, mitochondrial-like isoform X2 [Amphibalanus amphitrite]|uniref:39S ribosomal protein L48, mitochondrial-like isoform X2 n=1 Tax=Amphibalanus amphitrite TaxID=1232801 RepID=UPI001C9105E4|nr:39S ribosomal protein L48, mitochondrial-like isoform X2 [Amphibalanus amphitrite]